MSRSRSVEHKPHAKYEDVERLANVDGLVAVVSQRRKTGELTFAIFREFVGEDGPAKTQFVPERLGRSYLDLLKLTIEAMARMKATGTAGGKPLPYPIADQAKRSFRNGQAS